MSFFKKLFGGGKPESPAPTPASAPAAPITPPVDLSLANQPVDCSGIDWRGDEQLRFVRERVPTLVGSRLTALLLSDEFRGNPWCSPVDAAVLFSILAEHEPTRLMETGSGFTTRVFNHGKRVLNLPGELITIDPEPRCDVGEYVDAQLIMAVQDVPLDDFKLLMSGELAFFDLPHTGGEAAAIPHVYTKLLPVLTPGVLVGFHGVRLPRHYTREELEQGWCEHDALVKWLRESNAEILFAGGWLAEHHPGELAKAIGRVDGPQESTALWCRIRG
jgi:hypothetical protein